MSTPRDTAIRARLSVAPWWGQLGGIDLGTRGGDPGWIHGEGSSDVAEHPRAHRPRLKARILEIINS